MSFTVPAPFSSEISFTVYGHSIPLHRDDATANWIEKGLHLVPWNHDNENLMDRFDVRLYLLKPELIKLKSFSEMHDLIDKSDEKLGPEELKRLEIERYADLYEESRHIMKVAAYSVKEEHVEALNLEKEIEPVSLVSRAFFVPDFEVPPYIPIPASLATHLVIVKTCEFVEYQGSVKDIYIRARGDNKLDFVNADSDLHLYYLYLLKYKPWKRKEAEVLN